MTDIGKLFGERLKKIRKGKGYTQEDVATGIHESRSSYAEWEKGIEPKLSIVLKIAAFLKVGIEELTYGLVDEFSEFQKSELSEMRGEIQMLKDLILSEKPIEYKKIKKKIQK